MEVPKIYPRSNEINFKAIRSFDWEGDTLTVTDGIVNAFRDTTDLQIIGHYQVDCTELREFLEAKRAGKELSKPKWISAKEQLPKDAKQKIVYHSRGVSFGRYFMGEWHSSIGKLHPLQTVTHWMPLPEPPMAEEGE